MYIVDLAISVYCRDNNELYLPSREKKKEPPLKKSGKKTDVRNIVVSDKKSYNYYRYIPEKIFDRVTREVEVIISDHIKEKTFKDNEPKLTKKMQNDGFIVNATKDGFKAVKDGFVINRPTLCDLFEEIYESRVFNEELKSSY
jgi:hypothetical protein